MPARLAHDASGRGAGVRRRARHPGRPAGTSRLAHLADLHFGEAPVQPVAQLAAQLREAAPDAILVGGDLTRRAEPAEFRAAWQFLRSFGLPLLAVPGNHDIPQRDLWTRFTDPREAWRSAAPPALPAVLEWGGFAVVGLDSVRRAHWHLDWSAGGISEARLAMLDRELAARAGRRCIVLSHHPLRHPPGYGARRLPSGATAALALMARHRVAAILSGHLHDAAVLAGTPPQVITPSAFSPRGGRRAGWTLLELTEGGLGVRVQPAGEAVVLPWP